MRVSAYNMAHQQEQQQQRQYQHQHQHQHQNQHHPQQQQQQQPQYWSQKKKVEWDVTQNSNEPQQTETSSPMWDSEADHMLCYFLDGSGLSSPPQNNRPVISDRVMQHPFRTDNFPGALPRSTMALPQDPLMDGSSNNNTHDGQSGVPPPTPAIQHYFPSSSSSHKNVSQSSASNSGPSSRSSGIRMPWGNPFVQSQTQQPPHPPQLQPQLQPQQQQQQQLRPQQQHQHIDPTHLLKSNFLGAYHQQFTSSAGNDTTNNRFAFERYNARVEDEIRPMSPPLEFEGLHEPLLLPGDDGVSKPPPKQQHRSHAPAGAYNQNISSDAFLNVISLHPVEANKEHTTVVSSQPSIAHAPPHLNQAAVVATQNQFAQSIPSSSSAKIIPVVSSSTVVGSIPPAMVAPSLHPSAAAALIAGVGSHANRPFFFPDHLTAAYLMKKANTPEETEEKRAKRLERNRESARKSRRRKKDRLSNIEAKVNVLYDKIAKERRVQINSMDNVWKALDNEDLSELKELHSNAHRHKNDRDQWEKLQNGLSRLFIDENEQTIRKEVVEFQYNSLAQYILPRYQKYLLWTIRQSESLFLMGKEEHSKREFANKISTGKISSKQIGEEIANGPKQPWQQQNQPVQGSNQTARVSEEEKFWPLLCFELSISVEQEERFLNAQKELRQSEELQKKVSQIVAALRLASSAKECVLYQIYIAAFRKKKTYREILNPRQAILYQEWLLSNKDRVDKHISKRRKRSSDFNTQREGLAETLGLDGEGNEDLTLEKLCRYLEALKVSNNLPG